MVDEATAGITRIPRTIITTLVTPHQLTDIAGDIDTLERLGFVALCGGDCQSVKYLYNLYVF